MFCVLIYVLLASTSANLARTFEKPTYCGLKKHNQRQISTFLWRIKKQPPSYFFGTIHVPYTEVWEYVSPAARQAFTKSNTVFLELDLNNPRTLRTLAMCQLLPTGETLRNHLPSDLYAKLEKHMETIKANLMQWMQANEPAHTAGYSDHVFKSITGNWERKRPVWIMLMLNSLNSDGIRNRGVPVLDLYLAQEASTMSKPLGAVESAHEQCQPLNSLNNSHIIYVLNQTLSKPSSDLFSKSSESSSTTRDLVEHYNCGSLDETIFARDSIKVPELLGLNEEASSSNLIMSEINAYFRHELILKRNMRMADRVLRLLDAHPDKSFFFAFGAGHFLGDDSVINLVKRAGYRVESVMPVNSTKKRSKKVRKNRRRKTEKTTRLQQRPKEQQMLPVGPYQPYHRPPFEPTTRRGSFNELWIRIDGFTPRPWQEIEIKSAAKQKPQNYFLVHYNRQICCSSASRSSFLSLPIFVLILKFISIICTDFI